MIYFNNLIKCKTYVGTKVNHEEQSNDWNFRSRKAATLHKAVMTISRGVNEKGREPADPVR